MEATKSENLYRIVMAGDSGVGKTNLLMKYTENSFSFETKTTIGAQFQQKTLEIDGKKIVCQIWDTAGQERYQSITYTYFRTAVGAALVYDVTSTESFANIVKWLKALKEYAEPDAAIMLIGNKSDLNNVRTVSCEEAQSFAQKHGLDFIETSALSGDNVNKAFDDIAKKIYFISRLEKPLEKSSGTADNPVRLNLGKKEKKKKCCK